MKKILYKIRTLAGPGIFKDRKGLISYFADIAPREKEKKRLLLLFLKSNGNQRLISAQNMAAQQQQVFKDLLEELAENMGLSQQQAEYICHGFGCAIGENEKISFNTIDYSSENHSHRTICILSGVASLLAVILLLCRAAIYGDHIRQPKEWSDWPQWSDQGHSENDNAEPEIETRTQ